MYKYLKKVNNAYHNNAYSCSTCKKSFVVDDDGIWHCF
jgi:ribosomal protein L37AE/L43A